MSCTCDTPDDHDEGCEDFGVPTPAQDLAAALKREGEQREAAAVTTRKWLETEDRLLVATTAKLSALELADDFSAKLDLALKREGEAREQLDITNKELLMRQRLLAETNVGWKEALDQRDEALKREGEAGRQHDEVVASLSRRAVANKDARDTAYLEISALRASLDTAQRNAREARDDLANADALAKELQDEAREAREDLEFERTAHASTMGLLELARNEAREARERAIEARPEVVAFARAMEARLRDNDHKGGWKDCGRTYLFKRLREEMAELNDAVERRKEGWPAGKYLHEAADVANFAMMIADVMGDLLAPVPTAEAEPKCVCVGTLKSGIHFEFCPVDIARRTAEAAKEPTTPHPQEPTR